MADSTFDGQDTIPVYDAAAIETKWQEAWDEANLFAVEPDDARPKKYVLEMFPYPSGDLHMGHARNYTIGDAMARQARMRGFNVLHPMGFDAFGLPAENAAIKHNTQAAAWTYRNMDQAKATMHRMGFSYDPKAFIATCTPEYYRWGQWFFLKMWERGLVYRSKSPVNWCPTCRTVLANEQVIDGHCWRCGSVPEKRDLEQWYFKITDYAQELLDDLDQLNGWPERVKMMQRNWIGRSEGAEVKFTLENVDGTLSGTTLTVFTTRPDTLFGCSFFLLAPEHPMVPELVRGLPQEQEVLQLREESRHVSAVERQMGNREKRGAFTGRYVVNPINGQRVPVWIADYVLMDYGTGAVMAVPSGDQRDFEFARAYGLPIVPVVVPEDDPLAQSLADVRDTQVRDVPWDQAFNGDGIMVQSGQFTGMAGGKNSEGSEAVVAWLEEQGKGHRTVNFRLRDWLISRQRYWGNPIPMIHCPTCGIVPVPEEDLPVILPESIDLSAGQNLADVPEFYQTTCPKCGGPAHRETDTMDTFTCSSWYFLRYTDPHNDTAPFDRARADHWMSVDNYVGGIEHAILHLLYARFWTKVARDLGLVGIDEPFHNLLTQGMVKDENGDVMSKSKGNVVPPSSVIEPYGADTMRLTILFVAPPEKDFDWDPKAVEGCNRFLRRAWRIVCQLAQQGTGEAAKRAVDPAALDKNAAELFREVHRTMAKCTRDFEALQFNTAISAIMELVNAASAYLNETPAADRDPALCRLVASDIVRSLQPMCPHWSEELWHEQLGEKDFCFHAAWPEFDLELAKSDTVEVAVQVSGKVRTHITCERGEDRAAIEERAMQAAAKWVQGKQLVKVVVVPDKLVNIVVR